MLTIFAVPKPFRGHIGVIQRNAIRSWTLLRPACDIILMGNEEGIAEIAAEFNRYNRVPQFVIADESVSAQRFGGTFDADEPDSLVAFLRGAPGLAVEQEGDQLLIRSRAN